MPAGITSRGGVKGNIPDIQASETSKHTSHGCLFILERCAQQHLRDDSTSTHQDVTIIQWPPTIRLASTQRLLNHPWPVKVTPKKSQKQNKSSQRGGAEKGQTRGKGGQGETPGKKAGKGGRGNKGGKGGKEG